MRYLHSRVQISYLRWNEYVFSSRKARFSFSFREYTHLPLRPFCSFSCTYFLLEENLSGMHVGSGQFATIEVTDSGSTIQFVAKGHSISADPDVIVTYTSPVIIVSDDGYKSNNERPPHMKSWGGVLIALSVLLILVIAGIGYYMFRGKSFKADLLRRPANDVGSYITI